MNRSYRRLSTALLLALMTTTLVGSSCQPPAPTPPQAATPRYRPFRTDDRWIRDEDGRVVFLRGVNYSQQSKRPPFVEWMRPEHFDQIESLGSNAVRLLLNWEAIEPQRDRFNENYLAHMEKVLKWCEERDIWVILDMHQDIWARSIGGNGAPDWATRDDLVEPDQDFGIAWALDYYTEECLYNFDQFWNSDELQSEFCDLWKEVARRLGKSPAVIGYDLFNEPFPGTHRPDRFEAERLAPFYDKVIASIREVDADRIIFIEPGIQTSIGLPSFMPRMSGDNLGFMPHTYDISVQLDLPYGGFAAAAVAYSRTEMEARIQEMPLVIGEWGGPMEHPRAVDYVRDQIRMQESLMVAGAFLWSFNPASSAQRNAGGFHPFRTDGSDRPATHLLDRPYPRRVAGIPDRFEFDAQKAEFDLEWTRDQNRQVSGPTVIYLPRRHYPHGAEVVSSDPVGSWRWVHDEDENTLSIWADESQSSHRIRLRPAGDADGGSFTGSPLSSRPDFHPAVDSMPSVQRGLARLLGRIDDRVTYFVPTQKPVVAFTIDDGPDPATTSGILDVLDRHGVPATFFVQGNRIAGSEEIVRRMNRSGHEIGNHGLDGRPSWTVSADELARGMRTTDELLRPLVPVRWFRPGSAYYTSAILSHARALGYRTALGDVFPYDSWIHDSSFHVDYILHHVRPGSIVVLHDAGGQGTRTAETLDRVIPVLRQRGYRLLTLSELVREG